LVHGAAGATAAETASRTVFDKKIEAASLSDATFEMLAGEMPSLRLPRNGVPELADVLAQAFDVSKTAARKLIQQGAVSVNGVKLAATETALPADGAVRNRWLLVRKGAKEIAVVQLT
jgi:tyrosyl-tRNA synthetase